MGYQTAGQFPLFYCVVRVGMFLVFFSFGYVIGIIGILALAFEGWFN